MLPRTVLLADADYDSLAVYSLMLEHHGFRVHHAREAAEALRLACELHPDLVVAELCLSLGGEPVSARLKQDPCTASIPVIGLSAQAEVLGIPEGYRACAAFLIKPCTPSRLLREVQHLLRPPADPPLPS